MTTSNGVERAELKAIQEAQRADPVLAKYFNLPKAKLARRGMQVSPQGNPYKVIEGEQLMMVPHELRQKILVENHDVSIAGAWGSTEQWISSNGITGGVAYGGMLQLM